MRPLILVVSALAMFLGCLAGPTPTPIAVFQYPSTWTPAPTPTFTALPPTATLVIQRTPGAVQTRDPKVRVLPTAPRNRIGFWMSVSAEMPAILKGPVGRANLIVTDNTAEFSPALGATVLFEATDPTGVAEPLNAAFAGVVLTPTAELDLAVVRAAIAPKLLLISTFLTETLESELDPAIDGVRLENFLTEPETPLSTFPDEVRWKRDLDTLARLSADPNLVILTSTRLGTEVGDGTVPANQWLNFALSSFLIANNGTHSYFGMQSALTPQAMDSSVFELEIGTPLGGPFQQSGVYQRRFTRGLALVNVSNDTRVIGLSRKYVDGFGTRSDNVQLDPHTGMILLATE